MLNKTQKNMIQNAFYNLGAESCTGNATLILCVESVSRKEQILNDEVEQYIKDLETFDNLMKQGSKDLARSYAEMYL